jgi:hypothetical protein
VQATQTARRLIAPDKTMPTKPKSDRHVEIRELISDDCWRFREAPTHHASGIEIDAYAAIEQLAVANIEFDATMRSSFMAGDPVQAK